MESNNKNVKSVDIEIPGEIKNIISKNKLHVYLIEKFFGVHQLYIYIYTILYTTHMFNI